MYQASGGRQSRLVLAAALGMIGAFGCPSHAESLEDSQRSARILITKTHDLAKANAEKSSALNRGRGESETDSFGSFIFVDGELVGASVDQARREIGKAELSDKFRGAAAKVLAAKKLPSEAPPNESKQEKVLPTGAFQISAVNSGLGCRIPDVNAPLMSKESDAFQVNRVSSRVTVLSCKMSSQPARIIPAADEGPGTVHGCVCYRVCPPRTDARDSCYRVCECWTGP